MFLPGVRRKLNFRFLHYIPLFSLQKCKAVQQKNTKCKKCSLFIFWFGVFKPLSSWWALSFRLIVFTDSTLCFWILQVHNTNTGKAVKNNWTVEGLYRLLVEHTITKITVQYQICLPALKKGLCPCSLAANLYLNMLTL